MANDTDTTEPRQATRARTDYPLLAILIGESDASLARWADWTPVIRRACPVWATEIRSCSVEVRVTVAVPDGLGVDAVVLSYDDGTVERFATNTEILVNGRDAGGWVHRDALGANPRSGRAVLAGLRELLLAGFAEQSDRVWWRPTDAGRGDCAVQS